MTNFDRAAFLREGARRRDTPEWKQASASTLMPQHVRDQITNRLRLVCRNYVRA